MEVRIWGALEGRLIEVSSEPGGEPGLRVAGVPAERARTTEDRLRAALLNSGVVADVPPVLVRLVPAVEAGATSDLDLPLALAALASARVIGAGFRWMFATGRLGLDGTVHAVGLRGRTTLADVVGSLCQRRAVSALHINTLVTAPFCAASRLLGRGWPRAARAHP